MLEGKTKLQKLQKVRELFRDAVEMDSEFQREAQEDLRFHDGEQWTDEEKKILAEELRPCLTFNMIKSSIDLVMGLNEDNRVVYRATPVDPGDGFLAEVLNDLTDWVRDEISMEAEEDMACASAAKCGRGWVALDFDPDPKRPGRIIVSVTHIPIHEVRRDPAARKNDNSDAGFIFWDKWLTVEDFKAKYPKYKDRVEEMMRTGRTMPQPMTPEKSADLFEVDWNDDDISDFDKPLDTTYYDRSKRMIRLIHMEYWQAYERYYGFNPSTGQVEEFRKKDLSKLKEVFPRLYGQEFEYVTVMDKKVKWLQFIGDEVLFDDDSPLPIDGFSIVPCFAYSDSTGKTGDHFGIIRLAKDPQKEINKRWSQTLNLLNQQVQPGLYAEADAFLDSRQAEQSIKEAGSVTWLTKGALTQNKFQERKMPNFPNAPLQMEEYAQNMLRKITGINPDLLGMDRGRQEPGVVVRLRQQQGMTLLKPLFRSFKEMKRQLHKRLLAIIMAYMPDEQILEILGQTDRYLIHNGALVDKKTGMVAGIRDLRSLPYNLESEEMPGNKTAKMLELSIYIEMIQYGFPVDPTVIIEKLDLPATEKQRWLEYIEAQQKAAAESAQKQYELEQAKIQAGLQKDMAKTEADTAIKAAKLEQQGQKYGRDFEIQEEKLDLESNRQMLDFIARMRQVDAMRQRQQQQGGGQKKSA